MDPTTGFKEVYTEIYIKRAKAAKEDMDGEEHSEEKKNNEGEEMHENGEGGEEEQKQQESH